MTAPSAPRSSAAVLVTSKYSTPVVQPQSRTDFGPLAPGDYSSVTEMDVYELCMDQRTTDYVFAIALTGRYRDPLTGNPPAEPPGSPTSRGDAITKGGPHCQADGSRCDQGLPPRTSAAGD